MACVALTSLIRTIEIEFLQSTPRVRLSLHDRVSIFENISCLQAFLKNKSSGDGDGDGELKLRDLEIEIRDFALKVEDDIELQLSNAILLSEERASDDQTLEEAAKNAKELLESCVSEREMAVVALTILIKKLELYCLQHFPISVSLLEKLRDYCLLSLGNSNSNSNSGATAIKKLETKIRIFALNVKDDIRIQLSNFLLAKHTEQEEEEEETSRELHQTWQEAAESAEELLRIINRSRRSNEEIVDEANHETQPSSNKSSANVVESDGDGSSSSHAFLKPERGRMIGRHHDCTVIKGQLLSSHRYEERKIVSIVGMVGIGKTTVARNVYEDPSVASHFNVRAWATIPPPPRHYNKSQMLSQLLQSITPEEPNVIKKGSTLDELEMQVRKCLRSGRRYLIVLDNIISNQAWTDIKNCLPVYGFGSYILLTTRHFNQCKGLSNYIHNMTLLDPKESWELFCYIFSFEEHLAPKLEKIRNRVVEKCDGLPQLIVEVAKRLSKCNNIQQGWKKIEKELESLGILDRNAITPSYNILPHHLKVCLLYFGAFPKRKKIMVKMLIRLWIAEGFVKPLNHNEFEDEAYMYLQELIDRSLLLIEDQSCNGKIKTCRMHSALHSFCIGEAQKEGILCAVNTQQHSGLPLKAFANSCRWLSLYSHMFDYYVLFGTNIPHSIFFFHKNPKMLAPLKLLRVLAFDAHISLQRVPVQLGGLVFLRYLSITQWFHDLDDVVSNNPNLETLVVSGNGAPTIRLPSSIWKPPHLRHLELGNSYMVDPPSADKKNLQTLSWVVRPLPCRKKIYSKFPNIKNLKILLKDDIEPPSHIGGCCSNPIILDHFDYLIELEKLSISVSIDCNVALPEQCMYPLWLKKLKLSGTNICERDLNVMAMLPQLKVLKLENAFHGTVWEVARGGFRKLIFLLLEAKELKQWVASHKDFPVLRHLVLRSCYRLEQIPKGLARIDTLKSIELEGCGSSLVASAKQFQQDTRNSFVEIKVLGPEYDESHNTHTEVSM